MAPTIKEKMAPESFCRGVSLSFLSTTFFPISMRKKTTNPAIQMNDNIPNNIAYKHSIRYYTSKNPKRYANHTTNSP